MFVSLPPPPVQNVVRESAQRPGDIVRLAPGKILCAGEPVTPVHLETPFTTSVLRNREAATQAAPYALRFAIDADGRAVDIQVDPHPFPGFYIDTDDLAPALAASRFAAGMPRQTCSIAYTAEFVPITDAPLALLYETASAPVPGIATREIYERLNADGDCARGPGSPRRLNYPNFETIAQASGTRSWSFLRFDVDAAGHTRNVHVVGASGSAALDVASVRALRGNLYAPGKALHGCTFHFYRLGNQPIAAPSIPADAPKDSGALPACAIDPKTVRPLYTGEAYPRPFAARRIEGYAIIGFDTAPWGAVGNVRVLAAEPAATFGSAASRVISSGSVAESDVGHRGCVVRVQFRLPQATPAE
ncbi:TonB protein C-terminal [Sphingomonas sp. NFR15]|nr:TonB protein C-terminal [Sphingomonas sp. NFR15]